MTVGKIHVGSYVCWKPETFIWNMLLKYSGSITSSNILKMTGSKWIGLWFSLFILWDKREVMLVGQWLFSVVLLIFVIDSCLVYFQFPNKTSDFFCIYCMKVENRCLIIKVFAGYTLCWDEHCNHSRHNLLGAGRTQLDKKIFPALA